MCRKWLSTLHNFKTSRRPLPPSLIRVYTPHISHIPSRRWPTLSHISPPNFYPAMDTSCLVHQLSVSSTRSISLHELLSNDLVLYQTAPYLPPASLLALGATSKSFKFLIHKTPGVFRHLDLTNVKSAKFALAAIDHGGEVWRNVQNDENVTEDEYDHIYPHLI